MANRRRRNRRDIGPCGAVPLPGVGELVGRVNAPEQDDSLSGYIVGQCVSCPGLRLWGLHLPRCDLDLTCTAASITAEKPSIVTALTRDKIRVPIAAHLGREAIKGTAITRRDVAIIADLWILLYAVAASERDAQTLLARAHSTAESAGLVVGNTVTGSKLAGIDTLVVDLITSQVSRTRPPIVAFCSLWSYTATEPERSDDDSEYVKLTTHWLANSITSSIS